MTEELELVDLQLRRENCSYWPHRHVRNAGHSLCRLLRLRPTLATVAPTSTSMTDCQTGASATTSDSVAVVATGTAAMPSCTSRRKLALLRGANEPGLIDQDVAVRDDSSTASVSVNTSGKLCFICLLVLYYNQSCSKRTMYPYQLTEVFLK